MDNLGYLFAAYAIIWLAFFGYCYRLSRRQEELRRRLESLRQHHRALAPRARVRTTAPGPEKAISP